MTRWIAALALALTACATETRYVEAEGQDDAWLTEDAAAAWETVGVTVPDDYAIVYLGLEQLQRECGAPSPGLAGCALPTAHAILLNPDQSPELQFRAIVHELGHIVKWSASRRLDHGHLPHLDCAESTRGETGQDVMCATGAPVGVFPTVRDAAFVASR